METLEPEHCTPTRIMLPMDGNSESSPFCRSLLPRMPFRHLDYMHRTAFRLKSLQTPKTGPFTRPTCKGILREETLSLIPDGRILGT